MKGLITMLDSVGCGDSPLVRDCAWSVGWRRDPEVARKVREAMK
jgi:hypothetical protein